MSTRYFADLHTHPGSRVFSKLSHQYPNDRKIYNAWTNYVEKSTFRQQAKGVRAFSYSQSDITKCQVGRTKIVVFSLYPMEKGFSNNVPCEEILVHLANSFTAKFPNERIAYMQDSDYDYFKELLREYRFYLNANDISYVKEDAMVRNRKKQLDIQGKYVIVKDKEHLIATLESDDITMIPTIEGMHALGLGNKPYQGTDVTLDEIKIRIDFLRGIHARNKITFSDPLSQRDMAEFVSRWQHPPFFMTFAHHMDNTLSGHARSIPVQQEGLINQDLNLNTVLFKDGETIIKYLLGIDDDNKRTNQRRILIDVRHMSPQSRKAYYSLLENYRASNPEDNIPIIMSHSGYSGVHSLDELIRLENEYVAIDKKRKRTKFNKENNLKFEFYWWGINLSAEDVLEIQKSDGLIGISFDERILGAGAMKEMIREKQSTNIHNLSTKLTRLNKNDKRDDCQLQYTKLIMRNIEAIARIPFSTGVPNPESIWNHITIGSDFDGFIDPLNGLSTVLDFEKFEDLIIIELKNIQNDTPFIFHNTSPAEVARKICYENVKRFLIQYYPD